MAGVLRPFAGKEEGVLNIMLDKAKIKRNKVKAKYDSAEAYVVSIETRLAELAQAKQPQGE